MRGSDGVGEEGRGAEMRGGVMRKGREMGVWPCIH